MRTMSTIAAELRQALRLLRKAPGFTFVAVATLAVGIGINVAIFSVVSGVLLRPLPYSHPAELVFLWESTPKFPDMSVSFPDFSDWRKMQHSFVDVAASREAGYTLTGLGQAERLTARQASANWFRVLGVQPALGRGFRDVEEQPNAPPVVIVSDAFWRRRLHADPGAVGRTLLLDGRSFTIIGVLPPSFRFRKETPLWVTLAELDPVFRGSRGAHPGLYGVARLAPGVSLAQARADMQTVGHAIQVAAGRPDSEVLPRLWPLASKQVEDVRTTLLLLLGAVGFVLLIACANVANLMLARGTARSRELAVRAALGANRWALMRPLLVESALIAIAGGALAVILALWGVDLLVALEPGSIPRSAVIRVDGTVLAYSLGLTTATALLCGLVPAIRASRADVHEALKAAGSRSVAGVAHGRLRAALIVGEVALALVLLVGAGLSLRTFRHLSRVDVGFASEGLLTMTMNFSPLRYDDGAKVRAMLAEVQRRLSEAPGVERAALGGGIPFDGAPEQSFSVGDPKNEHFAVDYSVMPGYLGTLGIALLAGRDFDAGDGPKAQPVCIVDEQLATRFFGGVHQALGRTLSSDRVQLRIVGVVRHILHYGVEGPVPAPFQLYLPLLQLDDKLLTLWHEMGVVLRGRHPAQLVGPARAALDGYDPEMPLSDVATMEQRIADSVGGRRFAMLLLGVFAGVALLLAIIGLYAVMSYMVAQRQHELGVRMALGARAADVQRMVVRQGLTLVAIGLGLGVAVSLALARLMAALVNGVAPTDPLTYAAVGTLLALAAALASFLPARAATRVDPMVALRYD